MAWKLNTSINFVKPQPIPNQYNQYTIKKGDTLWNIAKAYNTDVKTLLKWNPNIKDANRIQAGAALNVIGPSEPLFKAVTPQRIVRKAPAVPQIDHTAEANQIDADIAATESRMQNDRDSVKALSSVPDTSTFMPKTISNNINTPYNSKFTGINNPFTSTVDYMTGSLSPLKLSGRNQYYKEGGSVKRLERINK